MTKLENRIAPLVYNGEVIAQRDEMLSLTDMWKASGSPDSKRPANWARKEGAEFIAFLADSLNVPNGHIYKAERGAGGSTFAHWQIGLAYAKYLSPEFHMWCNTVVRERMMGNMAPVVSNSEIAVLSADVRSVIGGIVKGIVGKQLGELMTVFEERIEAAKIAPTFDYAATVTSSQIIEMAGILPGQRVRGTSNVVTHAMLDFCNGIGCVKVAADLNPARPWRFPSDKAREWLFGSHLGAEQIRNQITRRRRAKNTVGQGAFRLVSQVEAPL